MYYFLLFLNKEWVKHHQARPKKQLTKFGIGKTTASRPHTGKNQEIKGDERM